MTPGRFSITRGAEPPHAGIGATFAGRPLVHEPIGLRGADVAIVGAPFDDGTSNRPGARYGPRAIRAAHDGRGGRPHLTLGLDPFEVLDVVDYGDVDAVPADLLRSHAALRTRLREVLAADAMPLVFGGDHSLSLPTLQVLGERYGADGYSVLHLDTHADTAAELYGVRVSHGTPFRAAVEAGVLRGANVVQVGLRGTWPGPADFAWMQSQGFRWHTMDEIVADGVEAVIDQAIAEARERAPRTYLSIDIDVLDPAFAPGTGTPEPGGLSTRELLLIARRAGAELELCAADVVEVSPPFDHAGITALAAERVAVELLSGVAMRRRGA